MRGSAFMRKVANMLASATGTIGKQAFDFSQAVAKALSDDRAALEPLTGHGFRKYRARANQWIEGKGQAAQYKARRRIHAAKSSSIRKIQTFNRLNAAENR